MNCKFSLRLLLTLLLAIVWTAANPSQETSLHKRLSLDIGVSTPMFLISIPINTVVAGGNVVTGTLNVYYQASRSIKVVGNAGSRYEARISMTTFMFFAQYSVSLWGGAVVHQAQDIIYVSNVQADIISLQTSLLIAAA
ncbi:hypothetical protein IWW36_000983 [Coemansia brasiliensis]|uniref:Uncharacterized protein n=1 Tax=Coemansia brasiliensis TaxID=2650707 RepID=A0A9W8I9Y4_9FUNG|nr:hypothetical protein IWW36_000983 [Coemansia brasiliensis]